MTARTWLLIFILGLSAFIYSTGSAAPLPKSKIQVDFKAAPGPEYVDNQMVILGVIDNQDGTSTVQFKACGAYIAMTAPNEMIIAGDPELEEVFQDLLKRACPGY